jgi:LytS/YehU family sensor histidine kinase
MVRGIDLFFALFNNLAIFIALVTVYRNLLVRLRHTNRYTRQAILGLSFGAFAIGCMYAKIPVFQGVIVDQRNAIVALSGAFGGPLSALICAALTGAFRIYLGGAGVVGGFIGVHLAALAGIGLYLFQKRTDSIRYTAIGALAAAIFIMPGFLFLEDLRAGFGVMPVLGSGLAFCLFLFIGHDPACPAVMPKGFQSAIDSYHRAIE